MVYKFLNPHVHNIYILISKFITRIINHLQVHWLELNCRYLFIKSQHKRFVIIFNNKTNYGVRNLQTGDITISLFKVKKNYLIEIDTDKRDICRTGTHKINVPTVPSGEACLGYRTRSRPISLIKAKTWDGFKDGRCSVGTS